MSQRFLIAALVASVALAQPAVNAPLLPQSSYVTGTGSSAVVGVVLASNYAFTADSNGVWGTNINKASNEESPFWDALPGVTQMWAWCSNWTNANTCNLHVIAGPAVALYQMNETTVWRASTFLAENATFNIISDSRSPSYMYPAMLPMADGSGYFYVLGTQNTSSSTTTTSLPSTVYAFNAMDLSVVWSTVVNADTSNFQTANCSEYVWILTQNQTFGYSDTIIRKLDPNNGALLDWSLDTQMSNSVQNIGVANGQFMVLAYGGYLTFGFYNGTTISLDFSIPTTCGTMPYAPALINSTWYAICGTYVEMWDSVTGVRQTPFIASNSIRCAAVHEGSNDFVLSGGDAVYVANASGISQLINLPDSIGGGVSSTCTGASFNWVSSKYLPTFDNITDIVHLSYIGYYSGSVLAINFRSGAVLAQAAANVSPLGGAIVDWEKRRLYTSSTAGNILQGYQFVPVSASTTSFIADLSDATGSSTTFSIAYNATNRSTYYISTYNLYTVDHMGETEQLATFSYVSSSVQPVIVEQFLVFSDSYNDNVFVWDSVEKVLTTLSVDDIDTSVNFFVSEMKVIAFVQTYSTAAFVVDLSASTLTATAIAADSYRQVSGATVIGTTLVINTGGSSVSGFDFTNQTFTTPVFVLNTANDDLYLVLSPPQAFNNEAYFVGYTVSTTIVGATGNSVFSVNASGWMTKVGELPTQHSTETKTLSIKSGNVFGGTIMYIIGSQNVTAYSTNWTMLFNYKSDQTIITLSSPSLPTVLDTGAICFFTTYAFTVVDGFAGGLAWYYNATSNYYPALTDNTTIYFSDGQYVIGAATYTGAVTSLSTFGNSQIRGYAIAAGGTTTTIIGATDDELVFANQVLRVPA
ncbi:Hypothetical protein, putative [Bodo saltans]|uniref:Membrane-associated protein n=1 Tax=Bodo saltans TaxID=75058 RepID=A0A0S4IWT8_BODSA|nr:Hypothetical protein, putative [Bodo saltans]|eukprot:CUG06075.1 Hypothetical protein, putative [Bodo saltans]